MAKYWEELGRKREGTEAEIGGVGWHELFLCEEVSWEEVVEVMKCLKRKSSRSGLNYERVVNYGGGGLVNVMLLMMNVVMKSECCH